MKVCQYPQLIKKLCIKFLLKFFLYEKIIFNIVMGIQFPVLTNPSK